MTVAGQVEFTRGYEDSYSATEMPSFEALSLDFERHCEHHFYARLNIPVWVDRLEDGRIAIGIFMPRHGEATQWIAPATDEQMHEIQARMLRVWAGRADTGFARYPEVGK